MRWVFDDGTVVHLGGKVEGNSELARSLRLDVAQTTHAERPLALPLGPRPSEWVVLDVKNPHHVDSWLRNTPTRAQLVAAPDVEREVGAVTAEPGRIY